MKHQLKHSTKTFYLLIVPVLTAIFVTSTIFIHRIKADSDNLLYLPIIINCPIQSPLINGDFEMGNTGWTFSLEGSSVVSSGEVGITPHGGSKMAYIIYYASTSPSSYIEQSFTVTGCSPYLSFWWSSVVGMGGGGDRCGGDLVVWVNGNFLTSKPNPCIVIPWEKIVVDLSSYRGQTITLRFYPVSNRNNMYLYLDDITIQDNPQP